LNAEVLKKKQHFSNHGGGSGAGGIQPEAETAASADLFALGEAGKARLGK
jgi:hypothetical protein